MLSTDYNSHIEIIVRKILSTIIIKLLSVGSKCYLLKITAILNENMDRYNLLKIAIIKNDYEGKTLPIEDHSYVK